MVILVGTPLHLLLCKDHCIKKLLKKRVWSDQKLQDNELGYRRALLEITTLKCCEQNEAGLYLYTQTNLNAFYLIKSFKL